MITEVCLMVYTVVGMFCSTIAQPPPGANCELDPWRLICEIDPEDMVIRASYYDPRLGGTNCMEPCDLLGDGTPVEEAWGWAAGCPAEWYDKRILTFLPDKQGGRVWWCRDTGFTTFIKHGRYYIPSGWKSGWYVFIDFLLPEREWWTGRELKWKFVDVKEPSNLKEQFMRLREQLRKNRLQTP